ncbi:membrane-bound O-acyltransferase family protein [Shewanella sp. JM162201]|uniref:Probable alginate O-acetylase n=1 Tax=Shewanella jiangmenensis TaxID=2837387 RepID=A0ABS5V5J3_9GAMM|nr:MBOAT family O-acyltransferase [Shewanella jiangmenensis]MBT1445097.1 membrane-bound O-acyltransferase family protein [Shewanella jiangmenensis]
MVFSSNVFLFLFLPAFLALYYAVGSAWRSLVIVLGSYLFYAWWRPDFLLLFVAITLWNFYLGNAIRKQQQAGNKRRGWHLLLLAVIGNLGALAYFKYANFGIELVATVLAPLGINTFTLETIILPLGISFYVFQAISYTVDIYRNQADPARNLLDFAAYISLFPQLIAGPIVRYKLVDLQLREREHSLELFSLGAGRFMQGFIKKVLIADSLAPISAAFLAEPEPQLLDAWFGLIASTLQLYFDFSGYSCMAIGLGMMMGFRFPENFNQPFMAQSITEFWQRWHITLSEFLRDYVYFPLVRAKVAGALSALVWTMFLSGLWHGASLAFICWGLFFGVAMVLERRLGIATKVGGQYRVLRHLRAFLMLNLSMPLFFTGELGHSFEVYKGLLGINGMGSLQGYYYGVSSLPLLFVAVALLWLLLAGRSNYRFYHRGEQGYLFQNVAGLQAVLLWGGFALALSRLAANSFSPFLYFQF